jgi:hypothetical protein
MAKSGLEQVNTTDTFQSWLNKTNELVELFNTDALTASPLGDTTIGNATLVGSFSANTVNVADTVSANTASVLSFRNRGAVTTPIGVQSPLTVSNTERTLLSLNSGSGPIVELTNQFPITWRFGLSSAGQEAELQFSRGSSDPVLRLTQDGITVNGEINGNTATATALRTPRIISSIGDVVWSVTFDGSSNIAGNATIQDNTISNAKFRTSTALTVVGRSSNSTGDVADITASTDHQVLRRSGTTLGFGAIALNQSAAVSGTLSVIHGGIGVNTLSTNKLLVGNGTSAVSSPTNLHWDSANNRLGINNSSPTQALTVGGNILASGDITAFSDERLKTNIVTIDNAMEKILQIRGVYYEKDGKTGMGVIAQEIEKIIPEVVLGEDMKAVAYGNIVGLLIEAIKDLKSEIDELKKNK